MKVLNLFSGIGGNRKLWKDVEVTAVELDPIVAEQYKKNFPQDNVVVGDAYEYLLKHFKEFDFIWASPPCPTHSRMRTLWKGDGKLDNKTSGASYKLPDMGLYSIIIFLQHFYKGDWVVENVISYYDPLIRPYVADNHYFWSNKVIPSFAKQSRDIMDQDLKSKAKERGMPLPDVSENHRKVRLMLNDCVFPEVGLKIFEIVTSKPQLQLFQNNYSLEVCPDCGCELADDEDEICDSCNDPARSLQ